LNCLGAHRTSYKALVVFLKHEYITLPKLFQQSRGDRFSSKPYAIWKLLRMFSITNLLSGEILSIKEGIKNEML
jgi:hypothetical protein